MNAAASAPEVYGGALQRPDERLRVRFSDGATHWLPLDRWLGAATPEECAALERVAGPVLDVGCGAGRHVIELQRRRVPVLGVDVVPHAVEIARRRGGAVLQRSVFAPLPGEGRWASALLLDGNVGIGGDPVRLLARCRRLLAPRGRVVVEVDPPGSGWRRLSACLERAGRRSAPFAWAVVGADAIASLSGPAGLTLAMMTLTSSGRRFAHLERVGPSGALSGRTGPSGPPSGKAFP